MRVRVKICGITSVEDGLAAAASGADAIGLNFYSGSSRAVAPEQAATIARALPPLLTTVGVFVDPARIHVESILDRVNIDLLQFHGDETPAFCESFGKRYVKVVGVRAGVDVTARAAEYASAAALLLDTHDPVAKGGTGMSFDWSLWPAAIDRPLILAGGLQPDNVGAAITATRPFAVDVCGGVEASTKGVKDAAKIQRFIEEVELACRK